MRPRTRRTFLALLPLLLPGGFLAQTEARRFIHVEWDLVGGVPPAMESELLRPLLLVADRRHCYVFDYGDHALKAFDFEGVLKWHVGRSGHGPLEFTNPTDLQLDAEGNIWVLDPPNVRVTVVDPSGDVLSEIRLPRPFTRILPVRGGDYWAFDNSERFWIRASQEGDSLDTPALPERLARAEILAREPRVTTSARGTRGALAFLYASPLFFLELASGAIRLVEAPESIEFPQTVQWTRNGVLYTRLDPKAPVAALSITSHADKVYVLFNGRTEDRGRIVDVYSVLQGRYLRSYHLPESSLRIAMIDEGSVAALIVEPIPAIRIWRRME